VTTGVSPAAGQRHLKDKPNERRTHKVPIHDGPKNTMRIACNDVVSGCGFTASADTEEELVEKVAAHAAHDHGVAEVTPELVAKVKAAITHR